TSRVPQFAFGVLSRGAAPSALCLTAACLATTRLQQFTLRQDTNGGALPDSACRNGVPHDSHDRADERAARHPHDLKRGAAPSTGTRATPQAPRTR
ncbi:MAG: hypothetical protein MPK06_05410, partial [Alphaproteobacteria bacterium]|nr:hypothetical protein [Alphaproteobacteria bacterium]